MTPDASAGSTDIGGDSASSAGFAGESSGGAAGDALGGAAEAGGGQTADPRGCSAEPKISNVLVLYYNPFLTDLNQDLRSHLAGFDAKSLAVRWTEHVQNVSGGAINYKIVDMRELNDWPPQLAGAAPLNESTFLGGPPQGNYTQYETGNADYAAIFESQKLCQAVQSKDISEIWIWGAWNRDTNLTFGLTDVAYRFAKDELPAGATADDLANYQKRRRNIPDCGRTLWVMGSLYTAEIGDSLRSYNTRIDEVMSLVTNSALPSDAPNPWQRFRQYALANPGQAQVGTPAYPPNGGLGFDAGTNRDWNYDNRTPVLSGADDWYAYPALTGTKKTIDCSAWHCSNDGFQTWYAQHIPHAAGRSSGNTCNNWWQYIADYDDRLPTCAGNGCKPGYALGAPCATDSQCASTHCACQGASMKCVAVGGSACPAPSWAPCVVPEDCISGVCGCNDSAPPRVCLPDASYPVSCSP